MAWLRENLWSFVAIASTLAAALAYAFAAFVEKNKDDASPKQAAFKTLLATFISGAALLWISRPETACSVPFQE